jgi:hypothetical protein
MPSCHPARIAVVHHVFSKIELITCHLVPFLLYKHKLDRAVFHAAVGLVLSRSGNMKRFFLALAIAVLVGAGLFAGGVMLYDPPAAADKG